jgi:predicted lipid-binding transport protein (Tim44 family)
MMDLLTLFFLIVAVIIFLRLRSVFGQRTGHERSPLERKWPIVVKDIKKPGEWQENKKIPPQPKQETAADSKLAGVSPNSQLAASLKQISEADANFTIAHFLQGAKLAYEQIVTAFAKGERDRLRPLLSSEIFANFDEEIAAREKNNEKVDFHFIGITRAEATDAALKGDVAQIGVLFVAKQVQARRNAKGEIIEGDATAVNEVSDIWTFERKLSSADPNWKLVEIEDV